MRLRYFLGVSVEALGVLEDELPEALGEVVDDEPLEAVPEPMLPEVEPPELAVLPELLSAAACSEDESLPSPSLSSDENCCSSEVPFASSREIEPSLFLSRDENVAPPETPADVLPEPEVEALGEVVLEPEVDALGEVVVEPEVEPVVDPEVEALGELDVEPEPELPVCA